MDSNNIIIAPGFLLQPTSVTQAEGLVATFLCQYPQAVDINWRVNGTGINQLNSNPGDIDPGFISLSDGMGGSINTATLNIIALSSFNHTEVRCLVSLLNGTMESSSLASLTIQGYINCVHVVHVSVSI